MGFLIYIPISTSKNTNKLVISTCEANVITCDLKNYFQHVFKRDDLEYFGQSSFLNTTVNKINTNMRKGG